MTERRQIILLLAGSRDIAEAAMRDMGCNRTVRGWESHERHGADIRYISGSEQARGLDRGTEVWLARAAETNSAWNLVTQRYENIKRI